MEILGYIQSKDDPEIEVPFFDKDENGFRVDEGWEGKERWVSAAMWEETGEEPFNFYPANEFEMAVSNICDKLKETLIKKNRDYGDSFGKLYNEYGDLSTEIRLTDKINRFKTLNSKENEVKDESREDTLLDVAGYSVLTLAYKRLKG